MINRSVAITIGFVLVGGVGVTSALGSLAGDPVGPTTTVVAGVSNTAVDNTVAVEATTQDANAMMSGSSVVDPTTTNPSMSALVATGMPSAPPPASIARGGDDDDDDDDDEYDDDHHDDDHHDDDDHDDDDHDDEDDD
jgi:hypothetical protein